MTPRPVRDKNRPAKDCKAGYRCPGRFLVLEEVGESKDRKIRAIKSVQGTKLSIWIPVGV
jgi:hypothetical protein